MSSPKAQIELFHLMFLQQFNAQIDAKLYAVKGGCNLRFFFNSARYSEDLDLDITIIEQETLRKKVNKILTAPALLKTLQPYNILELKNTFAKQTETTQRWKIQIMTEHAEMPYHTKIEFSRRDKNVDAVLENVNIAICQTYRLPPIRLSHYNLEHAMIQKILALAHRSFTQARDIFDIYHLLHFGKPKLNLDKNTLNKVQEALLSINFNDYRSQVVNFLEFEKQNIYNNKDYWTSISNQVFSYLNELQS